MSDLRLLSAAALCKRYGINEKDFRRLVREGRGPKAWNPLDGRIRYALTNVERWLEERDDRRPRPTLVHDDDEGQVA